MTENKTKLRRKSDYNKLSSGDQNIPYKKQSTNDNSNKRKECNDENILGDIQSNADKNLKGMSKTKANKKKKSFISPKLISKKIKIDENKNLVDIKCTEPEDDCSKIQFNIGNELQTNCSTFKRKEIPSLTGEENKTQHKFPIIKEYLTVMKNVDIESKAKTSSLLNTEILHDISNFSKQNDELVSDNDKDCNEMLDEAFHFSMGNKDESANSDNKDCIGITLSKYIKGNDQQCFQKEEPCKTDVSHQDIQITKSFSDKCEIEVNDTKLNIVDTVCCSKDCLPVGGLSNNVSIPSHNSNVCIPSDLDKSTQNQLEINEQVHSKDKYDLMEISEDNATLKNFYEITKCENSPHLEDKCKVTYTETNYFASNKILTESSKKDSEISNADKNIINKNLNEMENKKTGTLNEDRNLSNNYTAKSKYTSEEKKTEMKITEQQSYETQILNTFEKGSPIKNTNILEYAQFSVENVNSCKQDVLNNVQENKSNQICDKNFTREEDSSHKFNGNNKLLDVSSDVSNIVVHEDTEKKEKLTISYMSALEYDKNYNTELSDNISKDENCTTAKSQGIEEFGCSLNLSTFHAITHESQQLVKKDSNIIEKNNKKSKNMETENAIQKYLPTNVTTHFINSSINNDSNESKIINSTSFNVSSIFDKQKYMYVNDEQVMAPNITVSPEHSFQIDGKKFSSSIFHKNDLISENIIFNEKEREYEKSIIPIGYFKPLNELFQYNNETKTINVKDTLQSSASNSPNFCIATPTIITDTYTSENESNDQLHKSQKTVQDFKIEEVPFIVTARDCIKQNYSENKEGALHNESELCDDEERSTNNDSENVLATAEKNGISESEDSLEMDDDFALTASQLSLLDADERLSSSDGNNKRSIGQQTENILPLNFEYDSLTAEIMDQIIYLRESVDSIKNLLEVHMKSKT